MTEPTIAENSTYNTRIELIIAVSNFGIRAGCSMHLTSGQTKSTMYFQGNKGCSASIKAKYSPTEDHWRVEYLVDHDHDTPLCKPKPIKQHLDYLVQQQIHLHVNLKTLQLNIKNILNCEIDYQVIRRSLERAKALIDGSHGQNPWELLKGYLERLNQSNINGKILETQTQEGKKCVRIYWETTYTRKLLASPSFTRVIMMDATFLHEFHKGKLLIVATMLPTRSIHPLAFCYAELESTETYTFMLKNLIPSLPDDNLIIIADQHKGIISSVKALLPNSTYIPCAFHLKRNMGRQTREFTDLLRAENKDDAMKKWRTFKQRLPKTAMKLEEYIPYLCKPLQQPRTLGYTTQSPLEGLNHALDDIRSESVPVIIRGTLIWSIEHMLLISQRLEGETHMFIQIVQEALELTDSESRNLTVVDEGESNPVVHDYDHYYKIHSEGGKPVCECRHQEVYGYPCKHIVKLSKVRRDINLFDLVDDIYHTENVQEVVRVDTTEVPSLDGIIPEPIGEPDADLPQPGRPKKPKRILHPKDKAIMKKAEQGQKNNDASRKKSPLALRNPKDIYGNHGSPVLTLSKENLKGHLRKMFNEQEQIRLIDILAHFDNYGVSVQDLHRCISEMLEDGEIYNIGDGYERTKI